MYGFLVLLLLTLCLPLPAQVADNPEDWDDVSVMEGEGLTVTGTVETTQEIKVVDKEEIARRNAPDLASLLEETLDLGFTRYGGYGNQARINIRGFDSKRVAILVDGVPANSSQSGEFDINQIDLDAVERIEVIYGGSDTKYNVSGALGGVVNIITMKDQPPGLRIGGSLANTGFLPGQYRNFNLEKEEPHWEDLLDTQNISLSGSYGKKKYSVKLNGFFNRVGNHFLFYDSIFDTTRRKANNEIYDGGLSSSFILNLPDTAKFVAGLAVYYGDKNVPTSGNSPLAGAQTDFSTRTNLMLDMPRIFRDDLAMEASLSHFWQGMDYVSPADVSSRHDENALSAINRWAWYPGQKLTLRSGFDYRFIHLDSTDMGGRNRHDGGLYLTAEYKPVKQLLVVPSIKAAVSSGGAGKIAPVPKLGLLWKINDSFTLKNNYFRSFKFPDFEDLYWNDGQSRGNPDLRPEDGWGGDLGAAWRITERLKIESVFFTQWTKDSIHWYNNSGAWMPENVGEAIFFGLDSKLRYEIPVSLGPVKKIIPSVSYQYLLSYLLCYGYSWNSEKRIPYMPAHTIGGSLDIPWKTGSLLVSAHYESQRYADTANLSKLKPHCLLNAELNQKIGKNYTVFASVRNILNQSYESFKDYPMPGLTLTLGMRVNFDMNTKQNVASGAY